MGPPEEREEQHHFVSTRSSPGPPRKSGFRWGDANAVFRRRRKRPREAVSPLTFFVSIAVSFTVLYLISSCFRYVAVTPKDGVAHRAVASSGSDRFLCPDWLGVASADDGFSADELFAQNELGEGAAGMELYAPYRNPDPLASFWGPRRMPLKWRGKVREALHRVKDLATVFAAALTSLDHLDAARLATELTVLAAIELSAFGCIPNVLQPVRAEVATAYASLIERLLSEASKSGALRGTVHLWRLDLYKHLLGRLGEIPPTSEVLASDTYKRIMVRQWRVCSYTALQVAAQLQLLFNEDQRQPPRNTVQGVLSVVKAMVNVRKVQLLGNGVLRYWLAVCQRTVSPYLMYTREEYEEGQNKQAQSLGSHLDQVHQAIVQAGGTPVDVEAATGFSASPHWLFAPQSTALAHSLADSVQLQEQTFNLLYASLDQPVVSPPSGLEHSRSPLHRFETVQAGQASADHMQQWPEPSSAQQLKSPDRAPLSQNASYLPASQLPANHQQQGTSQSPASKPIESPQVERARPKKQKAHEAGWGRQQMPEVWCDKVRLLLETMRKGALTSSALLSSLSPGEAVPLVKNLAMLEAVQIAALAYTPARLQPLRAEVGMAYKKLLGHVLNLSPTRLVADELDLSEKLASLQVLLEQLSATPPLIETMTGGKYMKRMVVQYKVCSYISKQVKVLLEGLLKATRQPGVVQLESQVVTSALGGMFYTSKMHLLRNTSFRHWFVCCQKQAAPFLLYTQAEFQFAKATLNKRSKRVMQQINFVVRQAGAIPAAASPDDQSAASSHEDEATKQEQIGLQNLWAEASDTVAPPLHECDSQPVESATGKSLQPHPERSSDRSSRSPGSVQAASLYSTELGRVDVSSVPYRHASESSGNLSLRLPHYPSIWAWSQEEQDLSQNHQSQSTKGWQRLATEAATSPHQLPHFPNGSSLSETSQVLPLARTRVQTQSYASSGFFSGLAASQEDDLDVTRLVSSLRGHPVGG
ncbi:hypothetical protein Efla_004006 [Eimeria flavescens]